MTRNDELCDSHAMEWFKRERKNVIGSSHGKPVFIPLSVDMNTEHAHDDTTMIPPTMVPIYTLLQYATTQTLVVS